jgi:hypothetical protein
MVLAREISTVRLPDGRGGFQPLVVSEREIAPNHVKPPGTLPPDLNLPLGLVGLALAVVMLASRSRLPVLYGSLAVAFLIVAGLLGTILLALWTVTTHHAAWENANLLVFNPLAFAMVGAAWRSRDGIEGGRLMRTLVGIQVGGGLIGLLPHFLHFLPGVAQQNLPWLLFAIPVWLAIAVGLWAKPSVPRRNFSKPRRYQHAP